MVYIRYVVAAVVLLFVVFIYKNEQPPKNLSDVQKKVYDNFSYISDRGKWGVENYVEYAVTGDIPFTGDCEEYAIAIMHQLKKENVEHKYVITTYNNEPHAMVKSGSWCVDNNRRYPFKCD